MPQITGQTTQSHADKYGSAYAGRVFFASSAVPVTTSAGLTLTYTGLCLSNPVGSGKNLAIQVVTANLVVATAALTALGLIVGYASGGITVHTTPIVPSSSFVNGAAPVGLVDAACTLVGTPVWYRYLAVTPSATGVTSFQTDLLGGLIIPPGGFVALASSIAGPAAGLVGSIEWEENH